MGTRTTTWIAGCLAVIVLTSGGYAHVEEGAGAKLQFYSYYTSSTPVINACLTDGTNDWGFVVEGTDNDEWKDAYIRQIELKSEDESLTIPINLFLMNDDTYLYVGVTANSNNLGNNQDVDIVFDQGTGGTGHNDDLDGSGTVRGEFRARVSPDKGETNRLTEYSFNGSSWIQQNDDTEVFDGLGHNYGTSFVQVEYKIPLTGSPAADDDESYLDVTVSEELGLYISIYTTYSGGHTYYWHATNGDMEDAATAPGWADLRLGVERSYVTFYSTFNANGNPVIDGNISGGTVSDDAWRGCYSRSIILTDFDGSTINATLYSVEDGAGANNHVYVGLRVHDDDNDNPGDYCQIYQEQSSAASPATTRDYILDNGSENALIADENAFALADDRYWSGGGAGSWVGDATNTDQDAQGVWYSSDGGYYEYEFLIDRDAGNDGDDQDIYMSDGALMGFLIKYHDADGAGADYFWEFSPNTDNVEIDVNNDIYVATGWPDLQTGAPYVQVIFPEDNKEVAGVVNVRIYAEDEDADGVDSACFYCKAAPGTRYELTRIDGTDEWAGTWDVTGAAVGADTLVIEVGDNDGIVVQRLVNVTIVDGSGSANPPTVTLTSPAAGSTIFGTRAIAFSTTTGDGASVTAYISIDGASYIAAGTSPYSLNTVGMTDGSHTVQLKVVNDEDQEGTSQVVTFIVANSPEVTITAPEGGDEVSGKTALAYTNTPKGTAVVVSDTLFVDGKAHSSLDIGGADTLNTMTLVDGEHTIRIKATDDNDKTGWSQLLTLVVRNAPGVAIVSPEGGDEVSGKVAIVFVNSPKTDAAVISDTLFVDGKAYSSLDTGGIDTLNTMILADGEHTIRIKATDDNDKTGWSQLLTLVVRNAPDVAIVSPEGGDEVSGKVAIVFVNSPKSDAVVVSDTLFVDGKAYASLDTGGVDTLTTTDLPDGEHTIQIKATDDNGKTGFSQLLTVLVRNSPSVTLVSPTPDTTLAGTVTVEFAQDPVPPATIVTREIYVDGGYVDTAATESTYVWDTQELTDGQHTLQIKVTDSEDRTGVSALISLTLHNTPHVSITSPADTATLCGVDTIGFTADYAPGTSRDTTEISFDGGEWQPTTGPLSHVWVTTDFLDGSHTLQVRARGTNGKTGYSQVAALRIDNTPRVSVTSPEASEVVSGDYTVVFVAEPIDPAVITRREISLDGGPWQDSLVDTTSYVLSTADLEDGTHSIQVRATDDRGRTGYSRQVLFVTRNAPSVVVLEPVAGDTLNGVITVLFDAEAVGPALIESTLISVDGGDYRETETDSTASISTHGLADGAHIFKIRVVDDKGKRDESDERLFVLDNSPPIVADPATLYPDDAACANVGSQVVVTVLVKDIVSGLASVADSGVVLTSEDIDTSGTVTYVMRDDGGAGEADEVAGDNVYSALVTVNTDSSGAIGYSITATDVLGNDTTIVGAIRLDNVPPVIAEALLVPKPEVTVNPPGKRTYFNRLIMKGAYSDAGGSGLSRVFLTILNDSLKHVNNSPIDLSAQDSVFSRIINLVEGENYLTLTARDNAGNQAVWQDTVVYIEPKATEVVDRKGGDVVSPNGVRAVIPKDAMLGSTELTITKVDPIDQPQPLDDSVALLNVAHEFGPDGMTFRKPVTITLTYTEADLDRDQDGEPDFDPEKFVIVFWDGETWLSAGDATVDMLAKTVSVKVNHFTTYDIAQQDREPITELVTYWTHNPVSSRTGSNFIYRVPSGGRISLRILDLAGDLVYELIEDTEVCTRVDPDNKGCEGGVEWSGKNVAERFAGAGIYVYVFTYKRSGGKTTVIRKPVGLLR